MESAKISKSGGFYLWNQNQKEKESQKQKKKNRTWKTHIFSTPAIPTPAWVL